VGTIARVGSIARVGWGGAVDEAGGGGRSTPWSCLGITQRTLPGLGRGRGTLWASGGNSYITTSRLAGVTWVKAARKWKAICKGTYLGLHASQAAAARAYNVEAGRIGCPLHVIPPAEAAGDGAGAGVGAGAGAGAGGDPVEQREAIRSQFRGVHWAKAAKKWQATCKGAYLGLHTTEEGAARAYNVEAERLGRPLNGIPPAGAAGAGTDLGPRSGAGPKRAAPQTRGGGGTLWTKSSVGDSGLRGQSRSQGRDDGSAQRSVGDSSFVGTDVEHEESCPVCRESPVAEPFMTVKGQDYWQGLTLVHFSAQL
jgi:hypothetical protein